ncbi:LysM peptidoglycan-binding domain-containing protein [Arthrobacter sp. SD76]|uniref:LysM peptidoglycan-binding domain-containing protein n=1 Tax=Arthrobacter sp. SD76 TaxID=3415007 RepID=UPI003C70C62E
MAASAKSQARTLSRPVLAVAAASGIAFGVGAPAHAGVTGPDTTETASVQAYSAPAAAVAAPAAAAPAAGNVYTVVSGDTLGAISAAHGVSLNDVLAANGLDISTIIYPGDQITIPGAGYVAPAAAPAPAAPALASTGTTVNYASAAVAPAPAPAATGTGTGAAILASAYSQLGVQQDCTAMVEKALRSVGLSVGDLAPASSTSTAPPWAPPPPATW